MTTIIDQMAMHFIFCIPHLSTWENRVPSRALIAFRRTCSSDGLHWMWIWFKYSNGQWNDTEHIHNGYYDDLFPIEIIHFIHSVCVRKAANDSLVDLLALNKTPPGGDAHVRLNWISIIIVTSPFACPYHSQRNRPPNRNTKENVSL